VALWTGHATTAVRCATLLRMSHPAYPDRPLLRPGVRVCRRNDIELQVGLDPELAVVAPDTAEVRAVLEGLRHGTPPGVPGALGAATARLCDDLLARGLVVDGDVWLGAIGGTDPERAAALTALVAEAGPDAARLLARRASTGVLVDDHGLPRAGDRLRQLLSASGLATGDDLVVLLRGTEPDRAEVDHWLREDVPHVFLTLVEGRVRLGPFVTPGRTACLRCLDAHHAERDPRRALVVQQYAEAPASRDGRPEPVPADLLDLAVAYLARDVLTWAEGRRPATWSATVRVDASLELARTPWPRHPACGCSWGLAATG
jgi:bacteriocin biosynthesis cyclodehydratase domain-containing protein